MFSFPFFPPFYICRELAISQGTTFSFFSEISIKNEKMKMLSLVTLPIPCGYQKGEGRGRKTSQGFRKRPIGTCRPFQNGRLLIFRFLKFFTSVWYHLISSKGSWEDLKSLKLKCFQVPLMRAGIFH